MHLQCAFAVRDADAATRSRAVQRPVQTRELQPAAARVRFSLSGKATHSNSAAGGFEFRIELCRHGDGVFALRALRAAPGPTDLAFRARLNCQGVAVL